MMRRIAAIDLGSNTFRLLIADVDDAGRLREQTARRAVVRLGEGLGRSPDLAPSAVARALGVLGDFRREFERYGPEEVLAVATSAVRRARDGTGFVERIRRETGIVVEVIDGIEEARRTYLGVRSGMGPGPNDIVLDIGGGSTEWIIAENGLIVSAVTVDLGVVSLSDGCLGSGLASRDERRRLHRSVNEVLDSAPWNGALKSFPRLIGTAGTLSTLAALDLGVDYREAARLHRVPLSRERVDEWEERLAAMTTTERRALPGIEPGREDLIVAGAAILSQVMRRVGAAQVFVSDAGLREGIIVDWWEKTQESSPNSCAPPRAPDII